MIHPVVVNPVLSPVVRVTDPVRWRAGKLAPADSILHWDADIDAFTEQVGGPHAFNHAVLSPQYQRNADGSYSDVGARPAVDVFDGEKWLRSCGEVTNLLKSGLENFTTYWTTSGYSITTEGLWKKITAVDSTVGGFLCNVGAVAASALTYTVNVKKGSGATDFMYFMLRDGTAGVNLVGIYINYDTGNFSYLVGSSGATVEKLSDGSLLISITSAFTSGNAPWIYAGSTGSYANAAGKYFYARNPQLTATSYPVPYVQPGVTQPASNATTTNGSWFSLPDGSPLWQALTGSPLTLATRVRMGVGSGDFTALTTYAYLGAGTNVFKYAQLKNNGTSIPIKITDGSAYPSINNVVVSRYAVISVFAQVNSAGTQFRPGYMIEGTHTTIQWGSWVNFDGSFNPSTLYRLLLGYNNAYPMWFNKITAWKKQATDAEILEALA